MSRQNSTTQGPASSPLRLFGEAKDEINRLYKILEIRSRRVAEFYDASNTNPEFQEGLSFSRLKELNDIVHTIKEILSRNQMKVAFFGRTSNGKSTVINAILHDKILPMGYGHTTGCFLQIQGSKDDESWLEVQRKGHPVERKPIQTVTSIANALNTSALESSTLVKIRWPINKCSLLKHDVVIVDSPGVDVEKDLDGWIDEHCRDADVFVLVSNAESTLNIAEKNFFHKVSEKLSKPNIFILNNRWDSIADDPDSMDQVQSQHIERAIAFLSDELKISTHEEAKLRTFFVSAREMLNTRSSSSKIDPSSQRQGYSERCEEFKNFERRFEESLSKSAVKTKFKQHADKGQAIVREYNTILNKAKSLADNLLQNKNVEYKSCEARANRIDGFYRSEKMLHEEIFKIKKAIQFLSDSELDNEVRKLARIVDDFEMEFSTNRERLQSYKDKLYLHVEQALADNLRVKLNSVITKRVDSFKDVMAVVGKLLVEERKRQVDHIIDAQTYVTDDLFDLKIYKQFYTEFREDLEFRFSLGLVSIIRKFQGKFTQSPRPLVENGNPGPNQSYASDSLSANTDFLAMLERFMLNPPQSPTTVGSLAIGGVLVRTVGWRVIIVTTIVYGALYAYEYLTWTNTAKEKTFKAQYVRYAKKGLQDCVPIISQHIANSVEQKMMSTFMSVKKEVDQEHEELRENMSLLQSSLAALKRCEEISSELIGENNVLLNELVQFGMRFLS